MFCPPFPLQSYKGIAAKVLVTFYQSNLCHSKKQMSLHYQYIEYWEYCYYYSYYSYVTFLPHPRICGFLDLWIWGFWDLWTWTKKFQQEKFEWKFSKKLKFWRRKIKKKKSRKKKFWNKKTQKNISHKKI